MEQYYLLVAESLNFKFQKLFGKQGALDEKNLDGIISFIQHYHTKKNLLIWDINIFGIMDDPEASGGIYYTVTVQSIPPKENPEEAMNIINRNRYLYEIAESLSRSHKLSNISIKDIAPDVAQLTFKVSKPKLTDLN